jgi:hypothetical protein
VEALYPNVSRDCDFNWPWIFFYFEAAKDLMANIHQLASQSHPKQEIVQNWLQHKDANPWIFQGICFAFSEMSQMR